MRCSSSPSLTIFTRSARSAALRKLRFVFTRQLKSFPLIGQRFSDVQGIPLISITLAAFTSAWFLAPQEAWGAIGAVILLFGVLTLVNAPFDWFAVG